MKLPLLLLLLVVGTPGCTSIYVQTGSGTIERSGRIERSVDVDTTKKDKDDEAKRQ